MSRVLLTWIIASYFLSTCRYVCDLAVSVKWGSCSSTEGLARGVGRGVRTSAGLTETAAAGEGERRTPFATTRITWAEIPLPSHRRSACTAPRSSSGSRPFVHSRVQRQRPLSLTPTKVLARTHTSTHTDVVHASCKTPTHTLTHSLTLALSHPLSLSLTHSPTLTDDSLTITPALTHSLTRSLAHYGVPSRPVPPLRTHTPAMSQDLRLVCGPRLHGVAGLHKGYRKHRMEFYEECVGA